MLNLNDRKWKDFNIGVVFDRIKNSTAYHKDNLICSEIGEIAYISRTNKNNGLLDTVRYDKKFNINNNNTISFGAENATFFFQPYKYITGNKMYVLEMLNLNENIGLFLQVVLNISLKDCGFGYANGLTGTRAKKRKFMLPITKQENPDWQFMENYIKERKTKLLQGYINYIGENQPIDRVQPLDEKEWKEFDFNQIFISIQRGKRLKTADHILGKTPYVSSTAETNGVDNFIGNNKNVRKFQNCLTIANSGSVGKAFYHSYSFIASDHVTQLKTKSFNKYIYLFMAPIVSRLEEKYNFNHEINDKRIKREKLMLPIDNNGNPDWCYMEKYIKEKEYRLIQKYIDRISAV